MSFDNIFLVAILATMYIAWYAYASPSGVSLKAHTLAIASAAWLLLFFAYYMVEESPHRPTHHTAVIYIYCCVMALTYTILYHKGCIEEHKKLRDKSR